MCSVKNFHAGQSLGRYSARNGLNSISQVIIEKSAYIP